jgi:apolipoprotein N-acyltransferase
VNRFLPKIQISGLKPKLNRNDFLSSGLAGVLLALSYPPLEWSALIWIALIPVLFHLKSRPYSSHAGFGFLTGVVFHTLHLYWIWHVTLLGLVLLILYLSLLWAALFWGMGQLLRWRGGFLLSALLWAGVEFVRSLGPFTFAWGYLGHSLYAWERLLQTTYWLGVPGLSFLIFLVNMALTELITLGITNYRQALPLFWSLILSKPCLHLGTALLLVGSAALYGQQVLTAPPDTQTEPFQIALIQANIPHEAEIPSSEKLKEYLKLSKQAMHDQPALILWPESAMSVSLNYWPEIVKSIQTFVDEHQVTILTGTLHDERIGPGEYRSSNRAFQFTPGAVLDYSEIPMDLSALTWYDKIQLVPFGEFVPYGHTWPLTTITPTIEKMIENAGVGLKEPGNDLKLFSTPTGRTYAVAICFESTLARQNARARRLGADFLAVITYDSWFYQSAGLKQHFIQCAFRAAENRCYVIRSANTGITGVFGPTGRIEVQYPSHSAGYCSYTLALPRHK